MVINLYYARLLGDDSDFRAPDKIHFLAHGQELYSMTGEMHRF